MAPSVGPRLGTPALAPGIDWPTVAPFGEPVTGPVVDGTAVEPAPDELLCANANVLDKASAAARIKVGAFIFIASCSVDEGQGAPGNLVPKASYSVASLNIRLSQYRFS
jgi:hypothetical protein